MTYYSNIVLFNQNKNKEIDEKNRRLIAKIVPLCKAYNFHLILINYTIKTSPITFAEEMAKSTSIGESGEIFIELAKKGHVEITTTPLPPNCGKKIICTSKPNDVKLKTSHHVSKLAHKEKICLIFGTDNLSNNKIKQIRNEAKYHLDITKKRIPLELDTEIGAVCHQIRKIKKE